MQAIHNAHDARYPNFGQLLGQRRWLWTNINLPLSLVSCLLGVVISHGYDICYFSAF